MRISDGKEDEGNPFMWLRADGGERGLQTVNFQSLGVNPWTQSRFDNLLVGTEHGQYQAMAAAALQDIRNGDPLKQQYLHFQQSLQSPQQLCGSNQLFQQQIIQQSLPQQMHHPQVHDASENQFQSNFLQQQFLQPFNEPQKQQVLQQKAYQDAFQVRSDQVPPQQSLLTTSLCQKSVYPETNVTFSSSVNSNCVQSMLGTLCQDGNGSLLNVSRPSQSMTSDQQQQLWAPKFSSVQGDPFGTNGSLPPFPGKDGLETQNCNADSQAHTLFGVNIDSSSLLPTQVQNLGCAGVDTDASGVPLASSVFQNSDFNSIDDPSGLLHNAGQVDQATPTFVKVRVATSSLFGLNSVELKLPFKSLQVYKSGSVGRSLDIGRFSSYHELREELGRMFGIEGQLKDPLRSGWQLVFVDRENDVLLLGDDPWECYAKAFVNNVWYIKILSPEDVLKLGKQDDALSPIGGQKLSNGTLDVRSLVNGIPSVGSLDY
ncbi:Arf8p [Asimina triloba]